MQRRVLVVDDDAAFRELASELLRGAGLRVAGAAGTFAAGAVGREGFVRGGSGLDAAALVEAVAGIRTELERCHVQGDQGPDGDERDHGNSIGRMFPPC